ncbi:MAG: hypothetical protein ACI8R9_000725 [Paraglaciecola sp.]|jgi:uncharacterized protein YdbL (DUF1318 family)
MMKNLTLATLLGAAALLFSSIAFAIDLDNAKDQGLVGEQTNGYLGAVVSNAEIQALIIDVNAKRKAKYAELAAKNNLELEQVEKLAAKKAFDKTQSGHYLLVNDSWVKK